MTSSDSRKPGALSPRWASMLASVRAFGRGVAFTARLLVSAAPRVAVVLVVLTVLQAVLPILNVWLTRLIVNNLASGEGVSSLIAPLLVYLIFLLGAAGLAPSWA